MVKHLAALQNLGSMDVLCSVGGEPLLLGVLVLIGLLGLAEKLHQPPLHDSGLVGQFAQVELDPGEGGEGLQNRQGGLGEGELSEDVRHLSQQAGSAKAHLGGRPQQHPVEATDMAPSTTDDAVLTVTSVNPASGLVGFSVEHRYADDGPAPGNGTASDVSTVVVSAGNGSTTASATVRYGMAAGAAATLNPGTQVCNREDTDRLFTQTY